jgi:hypothetical protein
MICLGTKHVLFPCNPSLESLPELGTFATEQSEPSGFQLAVARRDDDRGRSGFSADTVDGKLHETHA